MSFNTDKQADGYMESLVGKQFLVYHLPMTDKFELEVYCLGRQGPRKEM